MDSMGRKIWMAAVLYSSICFAFTAPPALAGTCEMSIEACPNYPWAVGRFDDWVSTGNASLCAARAQDYYYWCGGPVFMQSASTTAIFRENGEPIAARTFPQTYNPATAAKKVWLSPNLASPDYLALMDFDWNTNRDVHVFKFHSGNLNDEERVAGQNVYPNFVARNGFNRLASFGLELSVETGVIKPQACDGEAWKSGADHYINKIQANGVRLKSLTMDEPLAQIEISSNTCGVTYQEALERTLSFIRTIRAKHPDLEIIDIEPYPHVSAKVLKRWIADLQANGARLSGFHLDFNREVVSDLPSRLPELIDLANFAHSLNLRFGIIYFSQRSDTHENYAQDILNFYVDSQPLRAVTDDIIFQSWHPSASGKLDMPLNTTQWGGQFSHLGFIDSAKIQNGRERGIYCPRAISQHEYLAFYGDVRQAGVNPFLHYKVWGRNEGRCQITGRCTASLSASEYLWLYDDVRNAGMDAHTHYSHFGINEGRCPVR